MSYVSWDERLETGIEAIDNDHRGLFDLVEQFHEAYVAGKGPEALNPLFATLLDYVDRHFRREEALFERIGYPEAAAHHDAHRELTAVVADLHTRYQAEADRGELCLEILAFLSNWLHFHIREEDMGYRDYMREKGIAD